jgi:Zn-dependent M16 (insulinase) family peptidase
LKQLAFTEKSGYAYETGGIMKNLRSLTVEKVRQYHKDFYRPDNLCLVISGKIVPEDVFKHLDAVEKKIVSKGKLPQMTRY